MVKDMPLYTLFLKGLKLTMKLLHLADLHIGKRVNEFSMLEEQKQVLSQALRMAVEHQVTAVLIAGDVYDKAIPSVEGVRLFDSFLTALARRKIPVCVISGNHDSPERLSFGKSLFEHAGLYMAGAYEEEPVRVTFTDEFGEVDVYLLPFIKPQMIRSLPQEASAQPTQSTEVSESRNRPESYTDAVRIALTGLPLNKEIRNVLIAHQFVTGIGEEPLRTDSETVSVGGVDAVDYHVFDAFDYVALGHLHGAQHVGRDTVRYAGSPVKYSFSEARQEKSATLVTLLEKGNIQIEKLAFTPIHDMREIKGTLAQLTNPEIFTQADTEDYIHVTLTDEEEIYDVLGKLRAVYPNLMQLDFDNRRTRAAGAGAVMSETVREKGTYELFREFFEQQTGSPMTPMQEFTMRDILENGEEE
ncbi:MAG: exonuclease SbcCD subunit D [Lachnospiraceae bacterium]